MLQSINTLFSHIISRICFTIRLLKYSLIIVRVHEALCAKEITPSVKIS